MESILTFTIRTVIYIHTNSVLGTRIANIARGMTRIIYTGFSVWAVFVHNTLHFKVEWINRGLGAENNKRVKHFQCRRKKNKIEKLQIEEGARKIN